MNKTFVEIASVASECNMNTNSFAGWHYVTTINPLESAQM